MGPTSGEGAARPGLTDCASRDSAESSQRNEEVYTTMPPRGCSARHRRNADPTPEVEPMSITPDTLSAGPFSFTPSSSSLYCRVFRIDCRGCSRLPEGPGKAHDTSQPSEHITNPRRDRHCLRP
eukprot:scaffold74878_cov64-Phaeocystis_antarctica.AAC.2